MLEALHDVKGMIEQIREQIKKADTPSRKLELLAKAKSQVKEAKSHYKNEGLADEVIARISNIQNQMGNGENVEEALRLLSNAIMNIAEVINIVEEQQTG